jgi:hypothetical protein
LQLFSKLIVGHAFEIGCVGWCIGVGRDGGSTGARGSGCGDGIVDFGGGEVVEEIW